MADSRPSEEVVSSMNTAVERRTSFGVLPPELDPPVRGDSITGDRYYSHEWMRAESEKLWTRTWHIGGMAADLQETGDYLVHDIGNESVVMVRQQDGSVRAFYNACQHRGNRLVWSEIGGGSAMTCSYHGWRYAPDGRVIHAQDSHDFTQGNPCSRLRLAEVSCDTWAGFVWFNMDRKAPPVRAWLGAIADQIDVYRPQNMTRVVYLTTEVPCNWKVIRDNFNESYHLPTLHPEIATSIDDDPADTVFEMYPGGHNRMIMKGGCQTGRQPPFDRVQAPLDDILRFWELEPAQFAGKSRETRLALQSQRRKLGARKGYPFFANLSDSQLTDYHHYTLFPNVSFTFWPEGFQVLRSEPHPEDPQRCIFDHWFVAPRIEGRDSVDGPLGPVPFRNAERERIVYGTRTLGSVADQDLSICSGQQRGLRSRGYNGGYLSYQEKRIQRFHELLNDLIQG
jgi:phenylpropionate dioxygenase-like ring-hydroxylating dioxygenase large terminal subunit